MPRLVTSGLNRHVLTHLSINSLTLVDQLELEFNKGMSVITGETGAGKSLIVDALALIAGASSKRKKLPKPRQYITVVAMTARINPKT